MLEIESVAFKVCMLFVMEYTEFMLISTPLLNQVTVRLLVLHDPLHIRFTVQVKVTGVLVPAVTGELVLELSITPPIVRRSIIMEKLCQYIL